MNVLIYGDSKYPALRHEVPVPLPDPIAYLEVGGTRYILAGSIDVPRLSALGGYEVMSFEALGLAELVEGGVPLGQAFYALVAHACENLGVDALTVPGDLPVELADGLRASGVSVSADGAQFDARRRSKSPAELAGIRRGQRAAELAYARIRELLREDAAATAESLRREAWHVFVENGCVPHDMLVIAAGDHGADPHDQGTGPIPPGVPIVMDIFPRDIESGCWGDLTRTLCVGEPPAELVRWHGVLREAQQRATEAVRAGISGGVLNRIACDVIREAGYPTRLDEGAPELLEEGFVHYLGHGLGLDLHEAPTLDEGGEILVPGDVITIEPGLYRRGFGGCRIEDIVLVTEDGYELITKCPYDLVV
jgi:Xaa-Pro aminopeptidase